MRKRVVFLTVGVLGCSDYSINNPTNEYELDNEDTSSVVGLDTGDSEDGPEDEPDKPDKPDEPEDTDNPKDTDEPDEPEEVEDDCYDPNSAYDKHPAAGLVATDTDTIWVAYMGSDAQFTSEFYLESPGYMHLGTGHLTPDGKLFKLGSLKPGTELKFSIHVQETGHRFYSGPADRNADGFNHAAVTYLGDCTWRVGFEDTYGGGDQDFDDIIIEIEGPLEMQLVQ